MAGLDILKQAGGSAIGYLEKAVIEIEDKRVAKMEVKELGEGMFGVQSMMTGIIKLASEQTLGLAMEEIQNLDEQSGSSTKRFKVLFNPNKLTLQAQGGGRVAKTNFAVQGKEGATKFEYGAMQPRIQVGVNLVFDEVEREDAFMAELVTDPLMELGTKVVNAARGKKYSVQPQVEGFIAALRNPRTRNITFRWNKLCYSGVLNYLDANYTMFSTMGRPIRATVDLGINCVDEDLGEANMGIWAQHYKKAFEGVSTNLESVTQNVGNLFNINL